MRIIYFANANVGLDVLRLLKQQDEEIVGLVLHPAAQRVSGDELVREAGLPPSRIFDAHDLRDPATLLALGELGADVGLSVLFGFILKPELLALFPRGVLNVHLGYLPYNRGRNAQVWSIIERTPVGATLHYIDAGVDTGPIGAPRSARRGKRYRPDAARQAHAGMRGGDADRLAGRRRATSAHAPGPKRRHHPSRERPRRRQPYRS